MKTYFGLLVVFMGIGVNTHATQLTPQQNSVIAPNELKQQVSQAIDKFAQTSRQNWSYRVTRFENEEGEITSSIEAFEANIGNTGQWSLMSMNGSKPTAKQIKKFTKRKKKQTDDSKQTHSFKLTDLIQLDTLQFEYETQEKRNVSFRVYLEKLGVQASEKLRGTLIFDKRLNYIERIEIVNTATFSPVFSAKITDFKLTLDFLNIDDAVLPSQQKLSMKGSFAFFTEIDEVSTDTYSDYQYHQRSL